MHQNLVLKAFEKVGEQIQRTEPYPIAEFLVNYIEENTGNTYTARSLVSKWNEAKKDSKTVRLKPFVVDALCFYLGFANFEAFNRQEPTEKTAFNWLFKSWAKCWFKVLLYNLFLVFLGLAVYNYIIRERWMEWQETQYVEVAFDATKLGQGTLKIYKKERIEKFKRIEADCETIWKNPDGSAALWYGKNEEGEYEWFSDLAKHPETGKSLKEVTKGMFDKYICPKDN